MRHHSFFVVAAVALVLSATSCSRLVIRPATFRPARSPGLAAQAPTEQQTKHDCGIASLEHAAKAWGVDIGTSLPPNVREQASSLASLSALAKRNGFDAFVLQAGSENVNPFQEITAHLVDERPLILLLRIPPGIGDIMSYLRAARGSQDFAGDSTRWHRHFVVLTKAESIGENGIAQKFTMMEPSQGKFRVVDSEWLDLFWRRQDAKYLLISK